MLLWALGNYQTVGTSPRRDQARPRRNGRVYRLLRSVPWRRQGRAQVPQLSCGLDTAGAAQILTFSGMLESYDEIPDDVLRYTAPGGPD